MIDFVRSVKSSAAIVITPTELDVRDPIYSIIVKITKNIDIFVRLFFIVLLY